MFKGSGVVRYEGYKNEYSKGKGARNKRKRQRVQVRRKAERPDKKREPDFRGYENF